MQEIPYYEIIQNLTQLISVPISLVSFEYDTKINNTLKDWEKYAPQVLVSHMYKADQHLILDNLLQQQICYQQSSIGISQIYIPLPDKTHQIVAGPFLTIFLPMDALRFLLEQNNILPNQQIYQYYLNLPILSEQQLSAFFKLVNYLIYHEERPIKRIDEPFLTFVSKNQEEKNFLKENVHNRIELQYSLQLLYMQAVKTGNFEDCLKYYQGFYNCTTKSRFSLAPLENEKLTNHIINMLNSVSAAMANVPALGIHDLYSSFTTQIESEKETNGELLRILMAQEYCKLVNQYNDKLLSKPVKNAVQYIETHLHQPIKPTDVANSIFYSVQSLNYLFHRELETSVAQYIEQYKMSKALELLRNFPYSISEITSEIGIQDQNYFSRLFKKTYGCTPTEFRRMEHG